MPLCSAAYGTWWLWQTANLSQQGGNLCTRDDRTQLGLRLIAAIKARRRQRLNAKPPPQHRGKKTAVGCLILTAIGGVLLIVIVLIASICDAAGSSESTPTPQAASCPTPAERPYFTSVGSISSEIGQTFGLLAVALERASVNPYLLIDPDWKLEMSLVLALILAHADQIRELAPPGTAAYLHRDMLEIASLLEETALTVAEGLDNLDTDRMVTATISIERIASLANSLETKVNNHCRR